MSRLPDDLPGRVDNRNVNHLATAAGNDVIRDDSLALKAQSTQAPDGRPVRIGPVAVDRIRRLLTARELAILESVDRFRYMTGTQLEQMHFADHASADTGSRIRRRVLQRLVSADMLVRLKRPIGGIRAGSGAFVHRLSPLGYRIVHREAARSGTALEPSEMFLHHTLAIGELAVRLSVAVRAMPGVELTVVEPEPASWRSFQLGMGGRETLKPDIFIALADREYEDRWFVEIDRSTESLKTIATKSRLYVTYMRTGIEQARHDVFPRVLWVVLDERRQGRIREVIRRDPEVSRTSELFTVTTVDLAVSVMLGEPK